MGHITGPSTHHSTCPGTAHITPPPPPCRDRTEHHRQHTAAHSTHHGVLVLGAQQLLCKKGGTVAAALVNRAREQVGVRVHRHLDVAQVVPRLEQRGADLAHEAARDFWNLGGVGLHILLQLLHLAARGCVERLVCADRLPGKQRAKQRVIRLARLHGRRLGDAAAAHAHLVGWRGGWCGWGGGAGRTGQGHQGCGGGC